MLTDSAAAAVRSAAFSLLMTGPPGLRGCSPVPRVLFARPEGGYSVPEPDPCKGHRRAVREAAGRDGQVLQARLRPPGPDEMPEIRTAGPKPKNTAWNHRPRKRTEVQGGPCRAASEFILRARVRSPRLRTSRVRDVRLSGSLFFSRRYFAWDEAGQSGTGHAYDLVVMSLQRQLWKVLSKIDFPKGRR